MKRNFHGQRVLFVIGSAVLLGQPKGGACFTGAVCWAPFPHLLDQQHERAHGISTRVPSMICSPHLEYPRPRTYVDRIASPWLEANDIRVCY